MVKTGVRERSGEGEGGGERADGGSPVEISALHSAARDVFNLAACETTAILAFAIRAYGKRDRHDRVTSSRGANENIGP